MDERDRLVTSVLLSHVSLLLISHLKKERVNVTTNETIRLAKAMLASGMVALSLGVPVAAQKGSTQNGVFSKSSGSARWHTFPNRSP